jgi:hypothetical protein
MQMALAPAALMIVSAGIGCDLGAQAATDSTRRDTTAQGATAAVLPVANTTATAKASLPVEVRGYKRTDSISLGGTSGTQYTYSRNKNDQINVFIAPYQPEDRLNTTEDTTNFALDDVDRFYRTIQLAADQGTVIHAFRLLHRGNDDFKTHGRTARGAAVWATFQRRGTAGVLYTYYAVFPIPGAAVRVRAELPAISVGNDEVPQFARLLVAGLISQ